MRTFVTYAIAVGAYIALGVFTKRFLTWTWGPVFFITTLEVLPRAVRRLRRGPDTPEAFGSNTSQGAIAES